MSALKRLYHRLQDTIRHVQLKMDAALLSELHLGSSLENPKHGALDGGDGPKLQH